MELQQFYVQQRDRVCKDGERFVSPAISQTKRHLQHELDEERKRKTKEEASDAMVVDVAKDSREVRIFFLRNNVDLRHGVQCE